MQLILTITVGQLNENKNRSSSWRCNYQTNLLVFSAPHPQLCIQNCDQKIPTE